MNSKILKLLVFILLAVPFSGHALAQTPTLVQHRDVNQFDMGAANAASFVVQMQYPWLSGNAVKVTVFNSNSAHVSSVSDGANTYSLVHSGSNVYTAQTPNNRYVSVFLAFGVSSAQSVTVTMSGASQNIAVKVDEFCNVNALDTFGSAAANNTTITAGSISPTYGDLLIVEAFQDSTTGSSTAPPITSNLPIFTAGSGQSGITWQIVPGSTQTEDGSGSQYGVWSGSGSINPQFTSSHAYDFSGVVIALKSASTGSQRTGMRVIAAQSVWTFDSSPTTAQFVTQGNLQVMLSTAVNAVSSMSSTGANTNAWSQRASAFYGNAFYAQIYDSVNTVPGNQTLTINWALATGASDNVILLDIAGAAASPVDTAVNPTGDQSSGSTLQVAQITPSTANGLIVHVVSVDSQDVRSLTGTGQYAINAYELPSYVPSECDENNGFAIYNNPDTSQVTFTWTTPDGSVQEYSAVAAAKAASVPALSPPTGLRLISGS